MSFDVPNPLVIANPTEPPSLLTATGGGVISAQVNTSAGTTQAVQSQPGIVSAFLQAAASATARVENSGKGAIAAGAVVADNSDTGYIKASAAGAFASGYVYGGGFIRAAGKGAQAFGNVYRTTGPGAGYKTAIYADQPGSLAFGSAKGVGGKAYMLAFGGGGAGGMVGGSVESSAGLALIQNIGGSGIAFGRCRSHNNATNYAQLVSFYPGGIALGYAHENSASGTNYAQITSAGYGALAVGYAGPRGQILAYGYGAFAHGAAYSTTTASVIWAQYAGAFAGGLAKQGNDIQANYGGSFAHGAAIGGSILASAWGSFAAGYAASGDVEVTAAAYGSFQLGQGQNTAPYTVKIGDAGLRFSMTTGLPSSPINGDFAVDGSGNVLMRSASVTHTFSHPTITGSRGGNAALANLLTALASMGLIVDGTSP